MKYTKDRTETVKIRISPEQKTQLQNLATLAGVSVTAYLLGCALGDSLAGAICPETKPEK